jgi:hypothetical protein
MVSTSLFRCLRAITTLGLIALAPAGCGDPCRDCSNIACSGSDIDCTRSNNAECEAKKKEALTECAKYKSFCLKSCGAPSAAPPAIL